MRLHEQFRKPRVSESLEIGKFAKLILRLAGGGTQEVTVDQLANSVGGVETLTAAKTLVAADSGTTYFMDALAGFQVDLPAPEAGLEFSFVVAVQPTSNGYDIATDGGDDIMAGAINELPAASAGIEDDNADNLNFVANTALAGDRVDMVSDGTSWFFTGTVRADAAVVASTT